MSSALASLGQLFLIFIGILLFAYVLWRVIWFRNYGGKIRVVMDPLLTLSVILVEIPIDKNFNIQEIN